ncbi:hypothetical protein HDU86_005322 [Geranomyces michiganensis]|nr:hypothetical protein HDU86_005322 [Geranomyces michiganensis]
MEEVCRTQGAKWRLLTNPSEQTTRPTNERIAFLRELFLADVFEPRKFAEKFEYKTCLKAFGSILVNFLNKLRWSIRGNTGSTSALLEAIDAAVHQAQNDFADDEAIQDYFADVSSACKVSGRADADVANEDYAMDACGLNYSQWTKNKDQPVTRRLGQNHSER